MLAEVSSVVAAESELGLVEAAREKAASGGSLVRREDLVSLGVEARVWDLASLGVEAVGAVEAVEAAEAETLICCLGAEGAGVDLGRGRVRWTSGSVPARSGATGRVGGGGSVGIGVTR